MISVPLGSAHIIAILFVFSELVLLPLVERATTSLAYLFLVRHTRNGGTFQVSPLRTPVFSGGLLNKPLSHAVMLAIRLAAAGILVYAETTLMTTRPFETEPRTVDTAFHVAPRADVKVYEEETNLASIYLRDYAASTFDRCTKRDTEGWIVASSANVTTNAKRTIYAKPVCLLSTASRVLREIDEPPAFSVVNNTLLYPTLARNFSIEVTWIVGPYESFPNTPDRKVFEPEDELMKISNVKALDSELNCSSQLQLRSWSAGSQSIDVMCRNGTGNFVQFFSAVVDGNGWNVMLDADQNGVIRTIANNMTEYKVVGKYALIPLGKLEFQNPMLFDTVHIMEIDILTNGVPHTKSELSTRIRKLLYTQIRNGTFDVYNGKRNVKTEIPLVFILVVGLDMLFVFGATIAIQIVMGRKRRGPKPNTVGGLSRLWKLYEGDGSERGGIDLYMAVEREASRRTYYFSPNNTMLLEERQEVRLDDEMG